MGSKVTAHGPLLVHKFPKSTLQQDVNDDLILHLWILWKFTFKYLDQIVCRQCLFSFINY